MTVTEDDSAGVDRRDLLQSLGAVSLGTLLAATLGDEVPGAHPIERVSGRPHEGSADDEAAAVFPQGVSSGDPTTSGAICWTRIDPDAFSPSTPLSIELTAESGLQRFGGVYRVDTDGLADRDHTVSVDLDGRLDPGRGYAYRFVYGDVCGPVGRFRTLPAPDASPDRLRFGVLTCQDYLNGYYGAFSHVADEDLDWLLHLGDFIYEWAGESEYDGRDIELPSGHDKAWGLDDFRHLYKTYRSDPFLQEALASAALVATWDDHEIVNNRFWNYEEDCPATNYHPRGDDPEFMRQLFADGIRAWWEHMPVRVQYDPDADSVQEQVRLYRSFRFGDLLELVVTDERLFRSRPNGDDGGPVPDGALEAPGDVSLDHTMLGADQRAWFLDTVTNSDATWTAWGNEVLNMRLDTDFRGRPTYENADSWDGYETERRLVMQAIDDADVENFVALTGDLHTALAGYLKTSYGGTDGSRVGVELMTPAVTSINLAEAIQERDVNVPPLLAERVLQQNNSHLKFLDSSNHGYAVVEFTPDACDYTAYAVNKAVDSPNPSRRALARFRVPAGRVALWRR